MGKKTLNFSAWRTFYSSKIEEKHRLGALALVLFVRNGNKKHQNVRMYSILDPQLIAMEGGGQQDTYTYVLVRVFCC